MRQALELPAPAVEAGHQIAQRPARLGLQFLGRRKRAGRLLQRHAVAARVFVQHLQRGVAEPALGHVDDALEGEIVRRRHHDAEIGQRVADFLPLVEARPADHAIGQPERHEAVLELAHLERRAHQDRDLRQRVAVALQGLDLVADRARFFLGIPRARDADFRARLALGAQASCRGGFCFARSGARRRRGYGRSSDNCARAGSLSRRGNRARSAGCCRPRPRASHRSTGRRRRPRRGWRRSFRHSGGALISASFRGAGARAAREPGIHIRRQWLWIPGSSLRSAPE